MIVQSFAFRKNLTSPASAFGLPHRRFLGGHVTFSGQKTLTLISADFDDSLDQHLSTMPALLNNNGHRVVTHLNTARSMSSIKTVAHKLAQVPLRFLSGAYGAVLFEKTDPAQSTADWLLSLTAKNQVPEWKAQLKRTTGWDNKKVMQALNAVLAHQLPVSSSYASKTTSTNVLTPVTSVPTSIKLLRPYPNEPQYRLKGQDEPTIAIYGRKLKRMLINTLDHMGIRVSVLEEIKPVNAKGEIEYRYVVAPANSNKSVPVDFLANKLAPDKIFTVGDHPHGDGPLLLKDTHGDKAIPNTRFVCGKNPLLKALLPPADKVVWVNEASGNLATEIDQKL
jgi:hypothetical protein